jgi:RND family efflux transporter MFP subunit
MNLDALVSNLNSISVSSDSSESKLSNAYSITQKLNDFLKSLSNYYSELCVTSDPNYNDERGAISAMKPILSSVVAEINAKKSALLAGANAVSRAERDLNLVNASTDNNKVKSAQSAVTQAKARLSSAQAQASKNSLYAPFAGVITKVDIVKGELASVGKPIVTMMSENNFEIEVKLSEVDVVKVKVGQEAVVTLDAYGADVKFPAVVTRMDPAATADNGVSTYKATLAFKEKDDMIKSGMNATVEIETMKKDSALTLPVSLVNFKVGGAIVTVKTSTSTEDRIVKTGARSNGKVEVVEGLTINDQVLEIAK